MNAWTTYIGSPTTLCEHPGAYAMSTGPLQMFLMFREVYLDRFEIAP